MRTHAPTLNRRAVIGLIGGAALAGVVPGAARAATAAEARALVQTLVDEINAVIDSGRSEAAMIREFEAIFARYADTSYVAAYAMGVDARRASPAQRAAFSDAFNTYVARKYGGRFREFIGGRLEVNDVRARDRYFEVATTAYLRGEAPFEVAFHVSDRTGRLQFFNMFIEGVNMLLAEREEIGAMIDRRGGDLDAMIRDLEASL